MLRFLLCFQNKVNSLRSHKAFFRLHIGKRLRKDKREPIPRQGIRRLIAQADACPLRRFRGLHKVGKINLIFFYNHKLVFWDGIPPALQRQRQLSRAVGKVFRLRGFRRYRWCRGFRRYRWCRSFRGFRRFRWCRRFRGFRRYRWCRRYRGFRGLRWLLLFPGFWRKRFLCAGCFLRGS